ncbi:hypothetical protein BN1095_7790001 [Clostridioides difficile]|uniref:Uncharacterized protein n=1 Tax=Clostridioides difficile TaxID=1496 RepID=A0A069B1N5_CLODI|nr:hypothetical protein BN1095_7790001 [Clostridioides difficile]
MGALGDILCRRGSQIVIQVENIQQQAGIRFSQIFIAGDFIHHRAGQNQSQ